MGTRPLLSRPDPLGEIQKLFEVQRATAFKTGFHSSNTDTQTYLFLDDVVWGEKSDFREFFLTKDIYLNERLAEFYDADRDGRAEVLYVVQPVW